MTNAPEKTLNLLFSLDVEDDWPPVAVESLPFAEKSGDYQLLVCPLFVKGLSVNDVIRAKTDEDNNVIDWEHVFRSSRTTIWLLRQNLNNRIQQHLENFLGIGCAVVSLDKLGCYAIDVPENVSISAADKIIECFDPDEVAVAFPSMRHPE